MHVHAAIQYSNRRCMNIRTRGRRYNQRVREDRDFYVIDPERASETTSDGFH